MYDYDDYAERRGLGQVISGALVFAVIATLAFYALRGAPSGPLEASAIAPAATSSTLPLLEEPAATNPRSTDEQIDPLTTSPSTASPSVASPSPASPSITSPSIASPSDSVPATPTTDSAVTDPAATAFVPAPSETVDESPVAADPATDLGFPAAPDGTPLPVIVTSDTGSVQLTGFVPSEAARERLVALATANSQDGGADVTDNLLVNPAVPASVGVRVIELRSARFGEGDARLTPDHGAQLDRVVAVMKALPHVSVLVIGHADQRGDDNRNLALSESRAATVVDYLVYLGVEPTRISMRGAGETDLLTIEDDASALALNRRTEFIFFGVLL